MNIFSNKNVFRFKLILSGGLFRLISSFSNLIISVFIIRTQSEGLWGKFVYYVLFLDLGFSVINWGHGAYLIREFSRNPLQIKSLSSQSFFSRSVILLLFIILITFTQSKDQAILLIIWSLARFTYQSVDPVIQFERKFVSSILAECVGILIIIVPITFSIVSPTLQNLILLYTLSFSIRGILMLTYYYRYLSFKQSYLKLEQLKNFFKHASPFFLITVSAMLQQRIDLYCVALFLPKEDIARYQIFLNLLILAQLGASLIISPFSKNIFRLSIEAHKKIESRFIQKGFVLVLLSIIFIYFVITYVYQFNISYVMYMMGYFYILSFYFYLLKNYELGKTYNHMTVAVYSFTGCIVNLILSYTFTPLLGIEGALLAGLITQFFITFLYYQKFFTKNVNSGS